MAACIASQSGAPRVEKLQQSAKSLSL